MGDAEEIYNISESDLNTFMSEAKKLVEAGGELIKSGIGKTKTASQVTLKDFNVSEGNASAVLTETDLAVEKLIVDGLKQIFPDHGFIGEEGVGAEFPGMVIKNNIPILVSQDHWYKSFLHSVIFFKSENFNSCNFFSATTQRFHK